MNERINNLIQDLRRRTEYCTKEDLLNAADFLEALKLALEALEGYESCIDGYYAGAVCPQIDKAIDAIEEALAQQAVVEHDLAAAYRTELDKLSQRNYELRMENAQLKAQPEQEPVAGEPAPENSLPSWSECNLIIENDEFRKRAAAGLEGQVLDTPRTTPKPTALHYFIHEYDDADPYRSGWFLHRLECVLKEAAYTPPQRKPLMDEEIAVERALDNLLYWTERAVNKGNANSDIEEAMQQYNDALAAAHGIKE